jgi:hypothetical protein
VFAASASRLESFLEVALCLWYELRVDGIALMDK